MSKTAKALVTAFSSAKLSTEEVATAARMAPQSIRAALCRQGNWAGLRPVKLITGRLLWDAGEVSRVLNGEVTK